MKIGISGDMYKIKSEIPKIEIQSFIYKNIKDQTHYACTFDVVVIFELLEFVDPEISSSG